MIDHQFVVNEETRQKVESPASRALSADGFDDLLAAPGVEVMFDDAEVTARLDGWDLNRWARHIAAKMLGNEVLPPAPDGTPSWPEHELSDTGAPPTPALGQRSSDADPRRASTT